MLTGLSITWPQVTNGNLKSITLGATTIYNTSTGGGTLTTSSLLGTTAQGATVDRQRLTHGCAACGGCP